MSLKAEQRYCHSLKKFVGRVTLPTHTGIADKGLVILLAGIQRRWKVSVAVYLSKKRSEEVKKQKVKAASVGANVVGVTSDMGADNLALWKSKGVTGSKNKDVVSSFPNPARENLNVYVLPDAVHLMKAAKSMMESNKIITLPEDIVEEEGLPSAIVNYNHIDDLFQHEGGNELKVAFRLRDYNIHCNKQFKKMNVGTTKAVLCHRTGVGLKLLAEEMNDPTYETTGWFIILLNTFFELVLCRHRGLAVSKFNEDVYLKTVQLVSGVADIFHRMKVGQDGDYKPAQRGMRVLCKSLLGLIEYFLGERKYAYLILGRFTSDCIENLFSCVRLSQPIPNAAMFLQCLKDITLAQFSEAVKGSSYDYEGNEPLPVDFLQEARQRAHDRALTKFSESVQELMENAIRPHQESDYQMLSPWEKMVVYDMAGSVIAAILKSNSTVCEICIGATKWKADTPHPAALITRMKKFTLLRSEENAMLQICVSDEVFHAILTAEISFRLYRERTLKFEYADVKQFFVENLMYVWGNSLIPSCHELGRKILTTYFDARLKEFGKLKREVADKENQASRKPPTVNKSSKSVAKHALADSVTVSSSIVRL
ncbi:hypothetical protein ONE63_008114 [Megalurothrips usitatus]|uniref:Transposable element P transposase-like RNase H domain-containing protein n=1 Tax=Megalurothrips usitatus TaxID=439358 RepID=A0AAV7XK62_9NEOP|nr:hypothetical protein ONE63_008114 [Megalurothrips usitatus]